MASVNISDWNNDNITQATNDDAQLAEDAASKYVFHSRFLSVALASLALPGNMFVIAVYIRDMTTSTKVYMFALAVADLTTCTAGLVFEIYLFQFAANSATRMFVLFSIDFAINFSVHLLAFVSIERLLAAYWPHLFSMSVRRAKIALSVISVETIFVATFQLGARMWNTRLYGIFSINNLLLCVVVMVVCYTLIAVKLLHDAKVSRQKVAAQSSALRNVAGSSLGATNTTRTTTAKTVKAFKGVPLLFIITVVFIACWLPVWLSYIGVPVPVALRSLLVFNFIANPYIYSAASPMFRKDARQFCGKTFSKLRTCLI